MTPGPSPSSNAVASDPELEEVLRIARGAAVRVSAVSDPHDAALFVSRSHRPPRVEALAAALGIGRVVPSGSVGVKIARLVLGQGDVYVHDGGGAKLWDACAPEAVLRAAGGRFSDLEGAPIDYANRDIVLRRGIVATNAALYDAVLRACGAAAVGLAGAPPHRTSAL